jgi:hypothetical protein
VADTLPHPEPSTPKITEPPANVAGRKGNIYIVVVGDRRGAKDKATLVSVDDAVIFVIG